MIHEKIREIWIRSKKNYEYPRDGLPGATRCPICSAEEGNNSAYVGLNLYDHFMDRHTKAVLADFFSSEARLQRFWEDE